MSETAAVTKKKEPGMAQLVIVLFAISAITALLLGLVNMITAPQIAINNQKKTDDAMAAVLPADSYTQVEYTGGNALVTAVYQAGDAGYVVQVAPSGFGGNLDIMVGVGTDGTCTGVSIISHSETSGLGANATKPAFRDQICGQERAPWRWRRTVEISWLLPGATITSRAVSDGVTAALEAAGSMG